MKSTRWFVVASLMAVLALGMMVNVPAQAAVIVSVGIAPPELPVYAQPALPGPGYMWTPGYWAYGPEGYYWVPGAWVMPPGDGLLWTPGYWGWGGSAFLWHAGYWGPHVGFYGGINYGFGYGGIGFEGGYWNHGAFMYNRSVMNIGGLHVGVYEHAVPAMHGGFEHTSFNGGRGGITARASGAELAAEHEQHRPMSGSQMQHENMASHDHTALARVNGGHPAMAAVSRAGERTGGVGAQGANRGGNENRAGNENRGGNAGRPGGASAERGGGAQRGAPAERGGAPQRGAAPQQHAAPVQHAAAPRAAAHPAPAAHAAPASRGGGGGREGGGGGHEGGGHR